MFIICFLSLYGDRDMPAYTQSTQLRTFIFECPKNKKVFNPENAIKKCLTRVRSLYTNWWVPILAPFAIILNQSNRTLIVFHFVLEAIKSVFRFRKCRRSHHLVHILNFFFLRMGPPPISPPAYFGFVFRHAPGWYPLVYVLSGSKSWACLKLCNRYIQWIKVIWYSYLKVLFESCTLLNTFCIELVHFVSCICTVNIWWWPVTRTNGHQRIRLILHFSFVAHQIA